ncbi:MAG: HigA family addiction module antitoxin [Rhodomicrobium sp.]
MRTITDKAARRGSERPRTHPGEILREDILPELGRAPQQIAVDLGIEQRQLEAVLNECEPVTPELAIRLGAYLGNGAEIWLRLQVAYDLWQAQRVVDTSKIPNVNTAAA